MRLRYLAASLVVLAGGLALSVALSSHEDHPKKQEMVLGFERMRMAESSIKEYAQSHNIVLEDEDIEGTYLIGPEVSPIATTMGYPEVKRSTLNPDNAALMVRLFEEAGLRRGDVVGVGTSGSFPGFLIATICAASSLGLKVRVIASLGASMYGATRPELSILDILSLLSAQGMEFQVLAVSPGGEGDRGEGAFEGLVYEGTRDISHALLEKSGYPILEEEDLASNIQTRKQLYGKISCFVNIGGGDANVGKGNAILSLKSGLVNYKRSLPHTSERGLVFEYLDEGVPVINILGIRKLLVEHGVPFDPHPLPTEPDGPLYQWVTPPFWIPVVSLVLALVILVWGKRNERREKENHTLRCGY